MKIRGIFLLGTIVLLFLSARREKITVYDLNYVEGNMNYIPTTSFNTGYDDEDTPYDGTRAKTISVDSFYLCRYEMTNGMYCFYLRELQKANVDTTIYNKALPDTLVWRERFAYNEPYVEYYLRHPAFADYPVVGINYDQAITFCNWLTKKYNSWPDRKFKKVKFDLPSKDQWWAAAMGGNDIASYPWDGPSMHNKKGNWLANFCVIDQGSVFRDTIDYVNVYGKPAKWVLLVGGNSGDRQGMADCFNDISDVIAPVKSYFPNGYGLYNMAGNVEEMVKEKGITKGGSWHDTGYYLQNSVEENYTDSTATSSERGFRMMMTVEK
jgi:formylglycine-generating enzyme required for sulfatase activity